MPGKAKKPITFRAVKKGSKNNTLISKVHAANKKKDGIENLLTSGLIDAYQQASLYGTKHFNSSKWLIKQLGKVKEKPILLLDVGALQPVYHPYKQWIDAIYIDLHPRHPAVRQADLLSFECIKPFDVVCLSLVINFVGCPKQRFQIIQKARTLLKPDSGLAYIVLPKAVIFNSRRFSLEYFQRLLAYIGFETVVSHHSNKLSFFLLKHSQPCSTFPGTPPNIQKCASNNFRICPM